MTWDIYDYEIGQVAEDFLYSKNIRIVIKKSFSSWCAYIGVPNTSNVSGHDYDNIDVSCHGGLTFSSTNQGFKIPRSLSKDSKEWYWYGWDYAHAGDALSFNAKIGHKWSIKEVKSEAIEVAKQFEGLINRYDS